MFPNPQSALPLPPRPNLEQYKKLAKDLVKVCKTGNSDRLTRLGIGMDPQSCSPERPGNHSGPSGASSKLDRPGRGIRHANPTLGRP
jgi:hypothetical protein